MQTVAITHLAGKWPVELVTYDPAKIPTYKVVERFQAALRRHGYADGVAYQVYDGGLVDTLVRM